MAKYHLRRALNPLRRVSHPPKAICGTSRAACLQVAPIRGLHVDHRSRLSRLWVPASPIASKDVKPDEDSHSKLVRAGFLRQAHSGIYHVLPLGCRVQDKIEALIDKHMIGIGASRLSLSSISSQWLWEKSGRLENASSELFRFEDRKEAKFLLAPTHEEEITELIAQAVKSYKSLPLRLYQITRKYRDELRPRHGLLRAREFIMKDLYTFDKSPEAALDTYEAVRGAYSKIFSALKLPVIVARASSGDMGGDLSHEYHLPTSVGEDHILSCDSCDYVANSELGESRSSQSSGSAPTRLEVEGVGVWRGISKDRKTLVNVWYPTATIDPSGNRTRHNNEDVSVYAIKSVIPDIDGGIEDSAQIWRSILARQTGNARAENSPAMEKPRLVNLVDRRLHRSFPEELQRLKGSLPIWPDEGRMGQVAEVLELVTVATDSENRPINLMRIESGEPCPSCEAGALKMQKAIELGHTFHLGTRYSEPLGATVVMPKTEMVSREVAGHLEEVPSAGALPSKNVTLEMGCHGIGISRIIGAVADLLADKRGLNWPRAIAPYEVAILPGHRMQDDALQVYDALATASAPGRQPFDLILDDRETTLGWKMTDADLVGYPVIVIVGKSWSSEKIVEVQCRRLKVRENMALQDAPAFINGLLEQL